MEVIQSPDGHDGFLLEFEQMMKIISGWLQGRIAPEVGYSGSEDDGREGGHADDEGEWRNKGSVFGEVEGAVDILKW
jgi:hypothetical protein